MSIDNEKGDNWTAIFFSHGNSSAMTYNRLQMTRKSLKKLRKWKTSHKPEVTLFYCFSKHFQYYIPSIIDRIDQYFDDDIDYGRY